jgi:hypothetical protein
MIVVVGVSIEVAFSISASGFSLDSSGNSSDGSISIASTGL